MRINISHELMKNMIKSGVGFLKTGTGYAYLHGNALLPFGLYSSQSYKKGDTVKTLTGILEIKPSKYSICIGKDMHVIDDHGKYMNHSFFPNTVIHSNKIIAIKDIDPFDEITYNYNDVDKDMMCSFDLYGTKITGK